MKTQKTLKIVHARWILFINTFHYAFYQKAGSKNQVAAALSKQLELLITMKVKLVSFDTLSLLNEINEDFGTEWNKC